MTREQVVDMLMNAASQEEAENAYEAMMDFFADDGFDFDVYRAAERIAVVAYHKGWDIGPAVEVDPVSADVALASGAPLRMAKAYTRIKWDAIKHPRDHDGKFRETPDMPISNIHRGLRPLLGPVESRNTTAGGGAPPPSPIAGGSEGGGPPPIIPASPGVEHHAIEIAHERAARHGVILEGKTWPAIKKEIATLPKIAKRDMRPESIEKIATLQNQAYNRYAQAVNVISANHAADVPRWVDFYPSARERMQEVADQFGVPPRVAIAMAAVSSPERRWPENKESETKFDNVGIVVEMLKDWVEYGELGAPERDEKGNIVLNDKGQPNLTKHYGAKSLRALLDRVQPVLESGSAFGNAQSVDLRRPPVAGDRVKSRKIRNFFANIMGDQGSVTIDRLMGRLAFDVEGPGQVDFPLGSLVRDPQTPTDDEYTAMENATRKIAAQTGWSPASTQAILWGYAREVMTPPINNYRKSKEGAAHYGTISKRPKSAKANLAEEMDESFVPLSPNDLLAALAVADNETALQILIDQMSDGMAGAYGLSEEENVMRLSEVVGLSFNAERAARVAQRLREFVESQHPRDTVGRFKDKPDLMKPTNLRSLPTAVNWHRISPTLYEGDGEPGDSRDRWELRKNMVNDTWHASNVQNSRAFWPDGGSHKRVYNSVEEAKEAVEKARVYMTSTQDKRGVNKHGVLVGLFPDEHPEPDKLRPLKEDKRLFDPFNPPTEDEPLAAIRKFIKDASEEELRNAANSLDESILKDILLEAADKKHAEPPPPRVMDPLEVEIREILGPLADVPWPGQAGYSEPTVPDQVVLADAHDWLYQENPNPPALKLWEDMGWEEQRSMLNSYVNFVKRNDGELLGDYRPSNLPETFKPYVEEFGDLNPPKEVDIDLPTIRSVIDPWSRGNKLGSSFPLIFEEGGPEKVKNRYYLGYTDKQASTKYRAAVRSTIRRTYQMAEYPRLGGRYQKVKVNFDKDDRIVSVTGIEPPRRNLGIVWSARKDNDVDVVRELNEKMELIGQKVFEAMQEHPEGKGLFDGTYGGDSHPEELNVLIQEREELFHKRGVLLNERTIARQELNAAENRMRVIRYNPERVDNPRPPYGQEDSEAYAEHVAKKNQMEEEQQAIINHRLKRYKEAEQAWREANDRFEAVSREVTPSGLFYKRFKKVYLETMAKAGQEMGMEFPEITGTRDLFDTIKEAAELYPKSWSPKSGLTVNRTDRGYYSGGGLVGRHEIALSSRGLDSGDYLGVAVHEIAHLVEGEHAQESYLSHDYLMWRTNGMENVKPLRDWGDNKYLPKSEKGDKDEFFNSYVGKKYESGSTEILTMGMDYMFWPRVQQIPGMPVTAQSDNTWMDERHRNYMLGRIATGRNMRVAVK